MVLLFLAFFSFHAEVILMGPPLRALKFHRMVYLYQYLYLYQSLPHLLMVLMVLLFLAFLSFHTEVILMELLFLAFECQSEAHQKFFLDLMAAL